ncbi:ABC transporter permease subunit [Frischella sp. Ac48]|uniref:Arginine ABC transporter permease protein ArtM n=1 Tax=Frischella japonica TaxID=2741544 RepID=A0ABR7QXU3_9GAMM|nr:MULTISPECIES: ABC transporter permease subunit [Frischella]MBC9131047.1 ABC transporter permease subunit [Frischella japonica]MBX4133872.1 ABC transporter permease subunit [Frischella sp. Ac48]
MSDKFFYYLSHLINGLPITISLSLAGILSACIISIGLSILLISKRWYIIHPIRIFITVFTGTPLLVQLFLIYYGPAQFQVTRESSSLLWQVFYYYNPTQCYILREFLHYLWQLLSYPWFCAYLALTLNSAAYTTLIFHGALKAVPQGHWQACSALGMNRTQSLKVILPYALKRALSSYSNEVIFVVKGTALTSTITLMDVMGYNQFLNGQYYDFTIFIATGCIYILINGLLSIIMRLLEKKALAFENNQ